ncbi:MAG: hypothetical protein AB4372_20145 [Xenococcus sp. (in: cyanobacteria)]|nr:hypothetical protein [Xenococcaceae cyanobacterium MO_167.B52]
MALLNRCSRQPIRQVHFWQKEIPAGTPIQNILSNQIFATEDYSGEDWWLQLEVTEVDTDKQEFDSLVNSFQSLLTLVS